MNPSKSGMKKKNQDEMIFEFRLLKKKILKLHNEFNYSLFNSEKPVCGLRLDERTGDILINVFRFADQFLRLGCIFDDMLFSARKNQCHIERCQF